MMIQKTLLLFSKFKGHSPEYLFRILPSVRKAYNTGNDINISHFSGKQKLHKNFFFQLTIIKWNNLDLKIRISETFFAFKKSILKFLRPFSCSASNYHSPNGIKLITTLTLGVSHLRELGTIFRMILIKFPVVGLTSRLLFVTFVIVKII